MAVMDGDGNFVESRYMANSLTLSELTWDVNCASQETCAKLTSSSTYSVKDVVLGLHHTQKTYRGAAASTTPNNQFTFNHPVSDDSAALPTTNVAVDASNTNTAFTRLSCAGNQPCTAF